MKERVCGSCNNSFASSQSLWNHKQRCTRMKLKQKTGGGGGTNSTVRLQKILRTIRDAERRAAGSGVTLHETVEKSVQSPHDESAVEEKETKNHTISKEAKKTLMKLLQSLLDDSEDEENNEEIVNPKRSEEDIEQEIFENVTLEERKRFYKLLNELKSRDSHLKREDFQTIDRLLPQYFQSEYGWKDGNKLRREDTSFSEQIYQELRTFQQELPLISLEMQIILNFMDKKRNMIKNLLGIVETNNKSELLERMHVWNDVLEDEYKELKNNLSKDTIAKVLSNRKFVPMNSDI